VVLFVYKGKYMEDMKKKRPMEVRIREVKNGFSVCGYVEDEKTSEEYVYDKLKKALKEIPSMFDVMKHEMPKMGMEDLKEEKERINKGEY
jgi:hypothetical protein